MISKLTYNFTAQGRYAEAEPLYRKGLEICQRVLGEEHPKTIIVRKNFEANKRRP